MKPTLEEALQETGFRRHLNNVEKTEEEFRQTDPGFQQMMLDMYSETIEDPLTGLLNRRGYEIELEDRLTANQFQARSGDNTRFKRGVSIIYLDLDEFKPLNDQISHEAGDTILNLVAKEIRKRLPRRVDSARPMGDEFIILYDGSEREATRLKEEIVKSVESAAYVVRDAETGDVSRATVRVSGGVEHIPSKYRVNDALERVKAAEDRMYAEKNGR